MYFCGAKNLHLHSVVDQNWNTMNKNLEFYSKNTLLIKEKV
jgi:hypothetical protein